LVAGQQGIAPMSRALRQQAIDDAAAVGIVLTQNVVGLDGVSAYVKADQSPIRTEIPGIRSGFAGADRSGSAAACSDPDRIVDWAQFPKSGKTGPILVGRRNDDSGTTDTFKSMVGITNFCPDVTIFATTAEIADFTSTEPNAFAYAGLSGERPGMNRPLAILNSAGDYVLPDPTFIRDFTYPLPSRPFPNPPPGPFPLFPPHHP